MQRSAATSQSCENWQRCWRRIQMLSFFPPSSFSLFLPAFTAIRATVGAWVACSNSSPSPCCCYCCVCYIIICKHLSIMQQQREQQQQQQQCLAGYLQRPEDAPGEAMRGKQPQQRPTGHINFPHRPQHTRQGALDAPLETRAEGSAFQRRSVWASIKCKWATPHQAQGQMQRWWQVAQTLHSCTLHVAINHKTAA